MARRPFKSGSENIWASALQGALQGFNTRQQMESMAAERELRKQAADLERVKVAAEVENLGKPTTIPVPDGRGGFTFQTSPTVAPSRVDFLRGQIYPDQSALPPQPGDSAAVGTVKPLPGGGRGGFGVGTPGEKAVDQAFGKEYADYVAGGGSAEVKKNIQQLDSVIGSLKAGTVKTGVIPGMLAKLPGKNQAALENVQQTVQTNLRQVLGPQFTAKEGEGILNRAYNPSQPTSENIARLTRLSNQIKEAAEAKAQAVDYFERNGTLSGFKGKLYTSADQFLAPYSSPQKKQVPSFATEQEAEASGYKGPATIGGRPVVID